MRLSTPKSDRRLANRPGAVIRLVRKARPTEFDRLGHAKPNGRWRSGMRWRRSRSSGRHVDRQLRALPGRWLLTEPIPPLLVHSRKVLGVREDEGGAHHVIHCASGSLQDCLDVLSSTRRVCSLDGVTHYRTGLWIERALTCYEYQTGRFHGSTVGRRLWSFIRRDDLFRVGHLSPPCVRNRFGINQPRW